MFEHWIASIGKDNVEIIESFVLNTKERKHCKPLILCRSDDNVNDALELLNQIKNAVGHEFICHGATKNDHEPNNRTIKIFENYKLLIFKTKEEDFSCRDATIALTMMRTPLKLKDDIEKKSIDINVIAITDFTDEIITKKTITRKNIETKDKINVIYLSGKSNSGCTHDVMTVPRDLSLASELSNSVPNDEIYTLKKTITTYKNIFLMDSFKPEFGLNKNEFKSNIATSDMLNLMMDKIFDDDKTKHKLHDFTFCIDFNVSDKSCILSLELDRSESLPKIKESHYFKF